MTYGGYAVVEMISSRQAKIRQTAATFFFCLFIIFVMVSPRFF